MVFVVSDCDPLVECFLNGLRKCVKPEDDPDNDCILNPEVMTSNKINIAQFCFLEGTAHCMTEIVNDSFTNITFTVSLGPSHSNCLFNS